MLGYMTLGTNNLEAASKFYDAIAAELGAKRIMQNERMIGWGSKGAASLMVCKPYDGQPATVGNGVMPALAAPSREAVDKAYQVALASGGKDEGAPGERMPSFYGAYFRDLDGNKLVVFHMG